MAGSARGATALVDDGARLATRHPRFARPRIATSIYRDTFASPSRQEAMARYDMVLLNMWLTIPAADKQRIVATLRRANPQAILGQYTILSEARDDHPVYTGVIERHDWWLRNASGERVQWTAAYGAHEVNITRWAPPDESGQRWPQRRAELDHLNYFNRLELDFVQSDTVQMPAVAADWRRVGSNQSRDDPQLQRAVREGHVAYWDSLRGHQPGLKVIANIEPKWLAAPEISGRLNGAFIEGAMGKSWSPELRGFDAMMARYHAAFTHLAEPRWVVFNIYAEHDDLRLIRYGLAASMLADGYFCPLTPDMRALWLDEFDQPMGRPTAPPTKAPGSDGVWRRAYENGLVLVNPSKLLGVNVAVGPGHRRVHGLQDPQVNHGSEVESVRLGPREGLMLLRR